MPLKIKNWKKFQHFKDRRPPWIKLYRDILEDPEWYALSDAAVRHLVMIWLVASENDGNVPAINKLSFRFRTPEKNLKASLSELSHWLEGDDITMASLRHHPDTPENTTSKKSERESKRESERREETDQLQIPKDLLVSDKEIKDWLEYKKQKGQTYKPKGLEALFSKFRSIPVERRRETVDNSMANGWTGLYEKSFGGNNGQQRTHEQRNKHIGEPERADSKFAGVVKTIRVGD